MYGRRAVAALARRVADLIPQGGGGDWKFRLSAAAIGVAVCVAFLLPPGAHGAATIASPAVTPARPTLRLADLLDEAQRNSPEIKMYEAGATAAKYRIPQATSLADPMVMVGYQNESFDDLTYPEMEDSQFMLSVSQMLPFPGKRALKGEMASRESNGLEATTANIRLRAAETVKTLYYELFLTYKTLDVLGDKTMLLGRLEDAATARYSSGMGMLQEVVMAQTEKYMIRERETMLSQNIANVEAMLCSALGRQECRSPLGIPEEPADSSFDLTTEAATSRAMAGSPAIAAKERMVAAAETRVKMAEKEYFPDFTVTGTVAEKGPDFEDMWSITTTVNVPIYYRTKQRQAVFEAKAKLAEAQHDLAAAKNMLLASVRDNAAMASNTEQLMTLYREGLLPKTSQNFELALASYTSGRADALTVINRLNSLIDFELLYWKNFVERQKAIARLETAIGGQSQ